MMDFARAYLMLISHHGDLAEWQDVELSPAEGEHRDLALSVGAYRVICRLLVCRPVDKL